MATQQSLPPVDTRFKLARSTVFPLVGGRLTWSHEHLLPILATIIVGLALMTTFNANGQPTAQAQTSQAWTVFIIIAVYIALMVNYYVREMCGRPKRLWVMALVALVTFLLMTTPLWGVWYSFFYSVIPGTALQKSPNFAAQLAGYFFGTGLCEESFKALPLLVLALLGAALGRMAHRSKGRSGRMLAAIRRHICVCEPLDGIVLGAASGSGFFIMETLLQYVPNMMSTEKYAGTQAFEGLVLLLSRGLPDLAEHSAWAGLFGYFIGLAVLRPSMAYVLLPIGWLSAAALHGAWDGVSAVVNSGVVVLGCWLFLGVLSYALLAGAIFKALEISPRLAPELAPAPRPDAAPATAASAAGPAISA